MVTFFWPFPKGENRFGNDAGKGIWYDRMSRFFSELCCLEKTERKGFFCLSAVNSGVWHVYGPCSVLQMHRELAKEEAVRQQRMWNSSSKLRKKGFKLIWLTLNCIRFFLKNWTKTASSAKNEPTSIIFFHAPHDFFAVICHMAWLWKIRRKTAAAKSIRRDTNSKKFALWSRKFEFAFVELEQSLKVLGFGSFWVPRSRVYVEYMRPRQMPVLRSWRFWGALVALIITWRVTIKAEIRPLLCSAAACVEALVCAVLPDRVEACNGVRIFPKVRKKRNWQIRGRLYQG